MPAAVASPVSARPRPLGSIVAALGRLIEEAGWWLLLTTVISLGVALGATPEQTGLVLAAWFLLRIPALVMAPQAHPVLAYGAVATALLATVGLSQVRIVEGFPLVLLVVGVLGAARALGTASGRAISAVGVGAGADRTVSPVAWLGLIAGGALAVAFHDRGVGLVLAAVLVVAGTVMRLVGGSAARAAGEGRDAGSRASADGAAGFQPLVRSRLATHVLAAFGVGALFAALLAAAPYVARATTGEPERAGIGLVLVGLGGLAVRVFAGSGGLLRVRQHVPPVLIVGAAVCASAILAIAVAAHAPWWAMLPALVGLGAVAALLDDEHVLRVRTAGVGAVSARSGLLLAAAAGQLVGAVVVVLVGGRLGSVEASVVAIALGVAAVTVLSLVIDRASLGALRHQVQQFSWNARPDPRPFEPPPPGTRPARLAGWLQRQVELELVDVTLPVSGRRYAIARPSGDGRDELFEQAKADPERQMPYWAKVWPSGVALADLVVERGEEVRGRQVLELGAGLGVTACAVLEEGGELITADYSLLPLAMCRLNGLVNTGRAPGSICFNWRDERQVSEVLRRHPPIGLVLAADVLYEYRDIQPLIDVIERLLAPGGSLWLAEPVRATAQRFLGKVAEAGWSIDSRRIRAEWPDATDGWVNIHVIRRDEGPADAALALGGWQL